MRKSLAASTLIAAALFAVPAPSATSAAPSPGDRVETRPAVARVTVKQQVVNLTNAKRRNHGCNNLTSNAALGEAAQKHSRKMRDANDLSHQLPGEAGLGTRVTNAGYRNWTLVGENIAWGQPTARSVVQAWMDSPSHRANILNCRFKHIGIGIANDSAGYPYWTQDFGRR